MRSRDTVSAGVTAGGPDFLLRPKLALALHLAPFGIQRFDDFDRAGKPPHGVPSELLSEDHCGSYVVPSSAGEKYMPPVGGRHVIEAVEFDG